MKDWAYLINLGEYPDTGTQWIALYVLNNNVIYFDSFGVEYIQNKIKKFIERASIEVSMIATNIFKMETYDLVMCAFFCIKFFYLCLKVKA